MTDDTRRAIRTALQTAIGVSAALPLIVDAADVPEALPGVATALAVAGAFARVMAIPAVQALLPRWLRTGEAPRK
ncbi:hypothetical protein GCM10010156_36290 [Planobispora rosea]|uniref:Holin n=1 Tax=Planobispora rosea TaxID=35762 RepID=A0A8J3S121_PLARO|nr:hypothetical protein [Planobispora rosea]GGS74089.1 hypothetical protein GCM10010156_36290 [Planobispora rosea]GIH81703.1 hypothetical protein Pro02_01110 [Planobispora rosea]